MQHLTFPLYGATASQQFSRIDSTAVLKLDIFPDNEIHCDGFILDREEDGSFGSQWLLAE